MHSTSLLSAHALVWNHIRPGCYDVTTSVGIGTRYRCRWRSKVSVSVVSVNSGIGLSLSTVYNETRLGCVHTPGSCSSDLLIGWTHERYLNQGSVSFAQLQNMTGTPRLHLITSDIHLWYSWLILTEFTQPSSPRPSLHQPNLPTPAFCLHTA